MITAKLEEKETRVDKWAAISGKWKFTKIFANYIGPTPDQSAHLVGLTRSSSRFVGLARSSSRFRDGQICTKMKLNTDEATEGGIFVRFQSPESPYAIAQIGAFNTAYAVSEFRPGLGWFARASAGALSNLNVSEPHELKVTVIGQSIRLTVDDVEVLSTTFSVPLEGTGFGLFTAGDEPVEFSETRIIGDPPKIFVIMPFAEPFDTLYKQVINPVATDLGFEVVRVDEVVGPGIIIEDIQRQIESSHAVIAEISSQNPNVFYELGYAHALRKPAILLVRRSDGPAMPFDIRSYRAIFYDDSIGGKNAVERNLQQHLTAILGGG
jgi:hypothetical protein